MKELLKKILAFLHISVTRNQKYDAYTRAILARILKPGSVCIDIGCHKGEILDLMLRHAPDGRMFGFEPIPALYNTLAEKYAEFKNVTVSPVAVYDQPGRTTFQHVLNAPAYSGIKKRKYSKKEVDIEQISVETARLDDLISSDLKVDLIKIDVEGAEFKVMKGATQTLRSSQPFVIFEFGLGAADYYGSKPGELFDFLCDCKLKISTLHGFLHSGDSLSRSRFQGMFETGDEYYFIAHP